ncbi:hypothetical protein [Dongia deserti]|uniref:hypothetical protein n=1 Tax=Dongia deserti TaxID=2268030 RepID=UPI000E6574F8|nr:hypothetical protein [Dongia deserti]
MKIDRDGSGGFTLHANSDELLIINNALNEICHGLPISDFEARIGRPLNEAQSILMQVGKVLSESTLN